MSNVLNQAGQKGKSDLCAKGIVPQIIATDLLSLNGAIIALALTSIILGALGKVQAAVICLGVSVTLIVLR